MKTRPLLISDCDEVLLHMVSHFDAWLGEAHGIRFAFETGQFGEAMTEVASGRLVARDRVWPLLDQFFREEMHRQTIVPGAIEALGRISEVADIVILTNLGEEAHPWRVEQLARHGISHQIVCNRGGKGLPVRTIISQYQPRGTVFVDDLAVHHASVAEHAPQVHRLHMVAEPLLAPVVPAAKHAHARIDDWPAATRWILDRLLDCAPGGPDGAL